MLTKPHPSGSGSPYLIPAPWPAPPSVSVFHSSRWGGVSHGPYASWNLGSHVGDDPERVAQNRTLFVSRVQREVGQRDRHFQCQWLQQVHGVEVIIPHESDESSVGDVESDRYGSVENSKSTEPQADGVFLQKPTAAAVVLTADCLPIVIADRYGQSVAVVHAGWRGLAGGIIDSARDHFRIKSNDLLATLGPCISPRAFVVGDEVRDAFLSAHGPEAATAFWPRRDGRWHGMLARLAFLRLRALGIARVFGFGVTPVPSSVLPRMLCDSDPFYSHRKVQPTGRLATVVVLRA